MSCIHRPPSSQTKTTAHRILLLNLSTPYSSTILYVVMVIVSIYYQTFKTFVWFESSPQSYQRVRGTREIYLVIFWIRYFVRKQASRLNKNQLISTAKLILM